MNGYELIQRPRTKAYYWRQVEPNSTSLIEALQQLPAHTDLEVMTGPEQLGDPTSVTYWPGERRATIS